MIEDEFDLWPVGRLGNGWQRLATRLGVWLDQVQPPEALILVLTALVVGLGAGFGAVIFRWLIGSVDRLRLAMSAWGPLWIVVAPAIGGLFVGPMIYFFAREAKGHGVPEVMEAVVLRGGRIRPIVVVIKSLASSICIGSGGSVGREGPIVQIGSALGSTLGQTFKLSDQRIRNLVACGAAGGIAATFNAPIAGVAFALEIILGDFSVGHFSTVVIASVTASVIGRIFLGNVPAFPVPEYSLRSPWELVLYALLGIIAAPAAVLFIRALYRTEDLFDAWRFPEYFKPVAGGLIMGGLGLYFPRLFGVGYEAIGEALHNQGVWSTLLLLCIFKIVATSVTIGSGGSGGVFAPSLFVGSMLGAAFGSLAHTLLPDVTASAGAYALVGMAAVFAAAARAPLTSILILFEMTDDYRLILPLMLATVISTLLAEHLYGESIYTLKLSRRGIHLERGHDIDVMQGVMVGEAMTADVDTVSPDMNLVDLEIALLESHHHGFPVVDADDELFGVVTIQDLDRAKRRDGWQNRQVRDIATTSVLTAYPDEPVWAALKRLSTRDVGRLPVVSRDDEHKLLGVVRRSDIVRAYRRAILRRMEMQDRTERLRLGKLTGSDIVNVDISESCPVLGRSIRQLPLPRECLIISVRRGGKMMIVHGDTVLEAGDRITALVDTKCRDAFEDVFCE